MRLVSVVGLCMLADAWPGCHHRTMERSPLSRRIRSVASAAIAGVVYAVLSIVALTLLTRYPDLDSSAAEIVAWFDDIANQSTLLLGLNLSAVSAIAFLWFVAVIRRRSIPWFQPS